MRGGGAGGAVGGVREAELEAGRPASLGRGAWRRCGRGGRCGCGRGGDRSPGPRRPHAEQQLTASHLHGLLRIVTDTDVRLWRRVHMDLVRYAGCVCLPSC
ncbi:putative leader peptide [Streptomyces sp. NPDC005900]|uniref:putative leader peptide n=1 Tax=Streptomyces sp. NPDC005900 TaxID=3154569 RepID=UPI0033D4C6E0